MRRSLVNWLLSGQLLRSSRGVALFVFAVLGLAAAASLLAAAPAPVHGSLSFRVESFQQVGGPSGASVYFDDFFDGFEPPQGSLSATDYFVGCSMDPNAESGGALTLDNASLCVGGDEAFIDVILVGGSFEILEGVGGLAEARFTFTAPMEPISGFGVELFSNQNGLSAMIQASADGTITAQVEPEGDRTGVIGSEQDITAAMAGVTDVTVRLDATSGTVALAKLDFGSDGSFDITLAGVATLVDNTSYRGGVIADTCALWCDEGHAVAGIHGEPELEGEGLLTTGSAGTLVLASAAPSKLAVLFVSFTSTPMPFKCGMLVPAPVAAQWPVFTNGAGSITIPWASWPGSLSGQSIYFQYAIKDAAAVCGVALSNALRADVP